MQQVIIPSVLAKNQQELDFYLNKLKNCARRIHLDVADGKFAPNKVLWFPFTLKRSFKYSAHLMIQNPLPWIKKHLKEIDLFIPHVERIDNRLEYIKLMRNHRKKIALALLPQTKVYSIKEYVKVADYILILTVHPGFYGSKYLPQELKKIPQIKKINHHIKIIVDGGMTPKTIKQAKNAGADYFISGSYTTEAENPEKSIRSLLAGLKE